MNCHVKSYYIDKIKIVDLNNKKYLNVFIYFLKYFLYFNQGYVSE